MREIAEDLLREYSNFKSINGTAESTTLEESSVDFITAGQAFHWFDVDESKEEFMRILKPRGWVVLIWNYRRTDTTPFLRAYEDLLLNFGTDYKEVNPANFDDGVLIPFFGKDGFRVNLFENSQVFDFEGLKGRLLSSSYAPMEGYPNYEEMMRELERIFLEYQSDGRVMFEYDTRVYYGRIEQKRGL
jgi:SAM-dependent methyltransferase